MAGSELLQVTDAVLCARALAVLRLLRVAWKHKQSLRDSP